jgi:GTP pyrophosphokinase
VVGGKNRVGLLRDIAATIAEQNINIADLALKKSDQHEILHELTIEVADLNQLNDVLDKLEKIEGVTKAGKV